MMTTSTQQRPLPAGVVGLSQIEHGPRSERREATPSGTLIIGRDIRVKGQIESCQSLIVEGRVEASLAAETLTVLKGGRFEGSAEVAVPRGLFRKILSLFDVLRPRPAPA